MIIPFPPLARAVKPNQYRCHTTVKTIASHTPCSFIKTHQTLLTICIIPHIFSTVPLRCSIIPLFGRYLFRTCRASISYIRHTHWLYSRIHHSLQKSCSSQLLSYSLFVIPYSDLIYLPYLFILPSFGLIYFYFYAKIRPRHIYIMGRHLHPRGMRTFAQPGPKTRIHQIEAFRSVRFELFPLFSL